MLTLISIIIGSLLTFCLLKFSFWLQQQIPFLNDPVYVPTTDAGMHKMLQLANLKKGEQVIDFGSGDGRLVIACAQKGCRAIGYEVHPWLVWKSRQNIRKAGMEKLAEIRWHSFWDADVSQADVIMLFTAAHIMERLAKKLRTEMKPDSRVVSQRFTFSSWKPKKQVGDVYLYVR